MSGVVNQTFPLEFHKHRLTPAAVNRQQGAAVNFEFNAPPVESPLSAELTGNIFTMLGRLSNASSNVHHLATTVSEHAATADLTDILDAHQDSNSQVTCSRQGRRVHVQVGSGSKPVLQLRGHAYIAPFRGWAASHLHLFAPTESSVSADNAHEQVIEGNSVLEEDVEEAVVGIAAGAGQPDVPQGHQLVTIVINIHNDALQHALQQAGQDVHSAQAQSAALQQQIDMLNAQLQLSDLQAASHSQQRESGPVGQASGTSAHGSTLANVTCTDQQGDTAIAALAAASDNTQAAPAVADLQQGEPFALDQGSNSELAHVQQQLLDLQSQVDDAARQRSMALERVDSLHEQLDQQSSTAEHNPSRDQALRVQLASAKESASTSGAEVLRLRSEAAQLSQQLNSAQDAAITAALAQRQLQEQLRKLQSEKEQVEAQLIQAQDQAQQLQALVDNLQSNLSVANQQATSATEALSQLTQQADQSHAAAEDALQQHTAAMQRAHRQASIINDLEHRLENAQWSLAHMREAAFTSAATREQETQALQGHLDAALDQNQAAATRSTAIDKTVLQLRDSLASTQAASVSEAEAHEGAITKLINQVADLRQQLTASQSHIAASDEARQQSNLQQDAQLQAVTGLETRLQEAEDRLQQESEQSAAARTQQQQSLTVLQGRLQQAVDQATAADAAKNDLTSAVQALQAQLQTANAETARQAEKHCAADVTAQGRVQVLQDQLAHAQQEAVTATQTVSTLQAQLTSAQQSASSSAAALQQTAASHQAAVRELQHELATAQQTLQQSEQAAAASDAAKQAELEALQTKLRDALADVSDTAAAELTAVTEQLQTQVGSAKAALATQATAHAASASRLQGEITSLQQHLSGATSRADSVSAELATAAADAVTQQERRDAEHNSAVATLRRQLQDAQSAMQHSTQSAAAAQHKLQNEVQLLHAQLGKAEQSEHSVHALNRQLSDSAAQLAAELESAKSSLDVHSHANQSQLVQLHDQVLNLQQQLSAAEQASESAAAHAASCEQRAGSAEASCHASVQAAAAASLLTVKLERKLQKSQQDLVSSQQAAEAICAEHQHRLESLQQQLDGSMQQQQQSQVSIHTLQRTVTQLTTEVRSSEAALAAEVAAKNASVSQLQAQISMLEQQVADAAHQAAAAQETALASLKSEQSVQSKAVAEVRIARGQVEDLQQQRDVSQRQLQSVTSAADVAATETASLEGIVTDLKAMCAQCSADLDKSNTLLQQTQAANSSLKSRVAHGESAISQFQSQLKEREQALAALQEHLDAATARADTASTSAAAAQAVLAAAQAEDTEQLVVRDTVMQQLLDLNQQHAEAQHALRAEQSQRLSAQQEAGASSSQVEGLQAQIKQLRADVQHFSEQAETASHACEQQQQLVQQLQGQVAEAETHKQIAMDGKQAEEVSSVKDALAMLQQQPSLHLLQQLSAHHASTQQPLLLQPLSDDPSAPIQPHPPLNTLSITDIIAQSYDALGLQSPLTPDNTYSSNRQTGPLDALLLDAAPSTRPELLMTNPVYVDGDLQAIVPATPMAVAPSQAVLHQAGLLSLIEQQLRDSLARLNITRAQLSDAEHQSSALKQQQEGAEDLVRFLRQELHNLRQDTIGVAAGTRQAISEKEALQATLDVAQAALLDQSEDMRQVTAERDTLLLQLQRGSISPTSSSPRQEDSISAYHIERHNSQQSISGSFTSSGRRVKGRLSTASTTSDTASSRPKWAL